jgi:hypothetical protein
MLPFNISINHKILFPLCRFNPVSTMGISFLKEDGDSPSDGSTRSYPTVSLQRVSRQIKGAKIVEMMSNSMELERLSAK